MKLDKNALSRLQMRPRERENLITAFASLGSAQDETDFATFGARGSRSEDGCTYSLVFGDTSVVFSLFYVARNKGHVVCTTSHPFDERRRLPVFDFVIDSSGGTSFVGEDGGNCDLANVSHMIGAMAIEIAMKVRLEAAMVLDSNPSSPSPSLL